MWVLDDVAEEELFEVATLIVGDFDAADAERDLIVETQIGYLQRVSMLSSAYLPLQYPLLFPRGEDGYRDDILLNEIARGPTQKRKKSNNEGILCV